MLEWVDQCLTLIQALLFFIKKKWTILYITCSHYTPMCVLRQLRSHVCASLHTAPEPMMKNCSLWMLMTRYRAGWGKARYVAIGRFLLWNAPHESQHMVGEKESGNERVWRRANPLFYTLSQNACRVRGRTVARWMPSSFYLPLFGKGSSAARESGMGTDGNWWESWRMYLTALSLIQQAQKTSRAHDRSG